MSDTRTLWIVRIVREAFVLAKDEASALDQQYEIERWESPGVEAYKAGHERLDGWDDDCLVYCDGDIKLRTAREISRKNS